MELNDELQKKFLTPTKFAMEIEKMVKDSNGLINYIDAVVVYCEQNEVEIESTQTLVQTSERKNQEGCTVSELR